jgi:hypothetical protein
MMMPLSRRLYGRLVAILYGAKGIYIEIPTKDITRQYSPLNDILMAVRHYPQHKGEKLGACQQTTG